MASGVSPCRREAAVNERLFFAASTDGNATCELWSTDATESGTRRVAGIDPRLLTAFDDGVLFAADDGITGNELWASDGTAAGTALVRDIHTSRAGSSLHHLTALRDRLVFRAYDDVHGEEPWTSDGNHTAMVKDIRPGVFGSQVSSGFAGLQRLGDAVLFFATDGMNPATGLWRSDGSLEGTALLQRVEGTPLAVVEDRLFFIRFAGPSIELWTSDGTAAGTQFGAVLDTNGFFYAPVVSKPTAFAVLGKALFFTNCRFQPAQDHLGDFLDCELWKSDGTTEGTRRVTDIRPGDDSSDPDSLTASQGAVFFAADDGASGTELWRSDGTEAGTFQVEDIAPGASRSLPRDLVSTTDALFFSAATRDEGRELWKNDATGTALVMDIQPGASSSTPSLLTVANNLVFFVADDGRIGAELWRSDGTRAGTFALADIRPGPQGSAPNALAAVGDRLLFNADDGVTGHELWVSDGTAAGTRPIQDIDAAAASSSPADFTAVGPLVYFTADDGAVGRELWAVPLAALAQPLATPTPTPTGAVPPTPTGTDNPFATPTATASTTVTTRAPISPSPTTPQGLAPCVGDCNGTDAVTVANLILGVNIALGHQSPSACPAFQNEHGQVDVVQLVKGVQNLLCHCGSCATPTPSPTRPTSTPSGTATRTRTTAPTITRVSTPTTAPTTTPTTAPTPTATEAISLIDFGPVSGGFPGGETSVAVDLRGARIVEIMARLCLPSETFTYDRCSAASGSGAVLSEPVVEAGGCVQLVARANDCCRAPFTAGCGDATCEQCVCAGGNQFCCTTEWDDECAAVARGACQSSCLCGPTPFITQGTVIECVFTVADDAQPGQYPYTLSATARDADGIERSASGENTVTVFGCGDGIINNGEQCERDSDCPGAGPCVDCTCQGG